MIDAASLAETLEADVGYNCSTSGGATRRGALGPFGLLVLADPKLSEQTAVYFYIAKRPDGGLQTHFCHDEMKYYLFTLVSELCCFLVVWKLNLTYINTLLIADLPKLMTFIREWLAARFQFLMVRHCQ